MQYAILIYETGDDFNSRSNDRKDAYWDGWFAYSQALTDAGKSVGGACLKGPETGTTLNRGTVEDGPYADTREQLGGFFLIEAETLDDAMEWAARSPAASTGAVEIRPVHQVSRT
ncbi:MAG: hypothetical protein CMF74_06940 [Maricaulis sp.]|jgi:hypothetical protein|nr:hypothetical protein [Maricaulis sp.]HAQ36190.1 hypothetical protein [Alphaproteobacteria bacterium]|tara:strand:+ start:598 stop:942 length:345 start_codon:yes stop_codon:yes gene_type:complete